MMKTFPLNFMKSGRAVVLKPSISALALLVCAFALTGCLSRPAMKTQAYSFGSSAITATNLVAGQPVLAIKKLEVAPAFAGRSLVYRTGDFSYVSDPYAAFLAPPEQELQAPLRTGLCSQGDFSATVKTGSVLKPDVFVEIEVSQLFGDFRQPKTAQAVLTLRFTFSAATNGIATQPLFQKEYSRSIPLAAPTAAALMQGWNQALNEILPEVLSDYRPSRSARAFEEKP
jgi:uncharacterized lipoprotein YmbA